MAFKVQVAVTKSGMPLIGSKTISGRSDEVAEYDSLYGSQLGFRVIAQDAGGKYHVCTKTEARDCGWSVTNSNPFPRRR